MTDSDAIGVLTVLALGAGLCIYAAGYAYGKLRGKTDTLGVFLDDGEDDDEWDAVFIEDGHLIMEEATQPTIRPPLSLINGGKTRPNRRKDA